MNRFLCIASFAFTCLSLFAATALADPLPGEVMKFMQLPLNGGLVPPAVPFPPDPIPPQPAPFPGHDELSTAYREPGTSQVTYRGTFMADDFADKFDTPVVHVQWWGSYLNPVGAAPNLVQRFLISFESDVAQSTNDPFSRPGTPLLNQIVTRGPLAPGSGTFTELPIPTAPTATEQLYQYNAELALPFDQDPNTVYWLKIVALDDLIPSDPAAIQWGWHNRDYGVRNPLAGTPAVGPGEFDENPVPGGPPIWHFQDDAVRGNVVITPQLGTTLIGVDQTQYEPQNYIPGPDLPTFYPTNISKDLAFVLYTTPEPASFWLMGLGGAALAWHRSRRRRAMC